MQQQQQQHLFNPICNLNSITTPLTTRVEVTQPLQAASAAQVAEGVNLKGKVRVS